MAKYVLALDQGTTSSRAILFDHSGAPIAVAQQELTPIHPEPGWVEQDPYEILRTQIACARDVLAKVDAVASDVVAIGIANQRETTLLWDRETGAPVYNAIVWQDRRTADLCDRLIADGVEELVRSKTGLVIDPYFAGTKLRWLLDNVPGARARAEAGQLAFGTVDTWLIWALTAGQTHSTDRTNASRTLLYSIVDDRWDDDLLALLRIPKSVLPDVVWSSEAIATVAAPAELAGIPIAGIAGDQQAALFGQLCLEPGQAKNTYGTGCFLLQHLGASFQLSRHKLLTTLACSPEHRLEYALEGSVFIGGAVVQWLRDNLRFFDTAADVEALAASVDDARGVYFVPAFTGLGAPHWDPHAGGLLIGLERSTQIPHIARAALESIAFQVTDVLEAMQGDTPEPLRELRVDGGAAANDLLMQFQADLLGVPIRRPAILETTALGAAYLAGLATRFWSGTQELQGHRKAERLFQPSGDRVPLQQRMKRWHEAVSRTKGWNAPESNS